jgi:hypothetical protein
MKTEKLNISIAFFIICSSFALFFGCKDDEDLFQETRLFRPVLNEDLRAEGNSILVDMARLKKAVSYTLEVSRDTFKTIEYTIQSESNYVVIDDALLGDSPLLWNTLYQIRVIAHAVSSELDSRQSDLGNVRTEKYPSILSIPTSADVVDVAARVFWANAGNPVTHVKVFAANDVRLTTPLFEHDLSAEDLAAQMKIVYSLAPGTTYIIALYSDDELRGYENYTTLPEGPTGPNVIDLRSVAFKATLVTDTLPDIPSGSLILLNKGKIYSMSGSALVLDKSVTFMSGLDFGENATLHFTGNFNFPTGVNPIVDSLVFRDVILTGGSIGSNYVGNFSQPGTIGTLKFDNVEASVFRGLIRTQGAVSINIANYIINNCVLDSLGGYGVITIDNALNKLDNILIENTTISKANVFIHSKNNLNSIAIRSCTISEAPVVGGRMFRFSGGVGKNDVVSGITITDCIWGHGWDAGSSGVLTVIGTEGLPATNFSVVNTYATSDFGFASAPIPGFPSFTDNNTAVSLWTDPYNENFNFKDSGFSGKFDSGDARWRIKL